MDTLTRSRSPMTVITANGEVQTHEEATVYVKDLDFSWQWNSSRIRQQYCRWESFAMNMDTHMSGSTVKKPHLIKKVFEYSVIRKTSYQSLFLVYLQLPQARLFQHPRLHQVRKLIIQITIQQSSQVKVWIDKHGETRTFLKHQKSCYVNQPKSPNQIKMRITKRYWEARIPTYQNGCKSSERILRMKESLNTETHTRVLLMNHLQNLWEVWI